MNPQIAGRGKRLGAHVTLVRLLLQKFQVLVLCSTSSEAAQALPHYLQVYHSVVVEIRAGSERLAADVAHMWPFSGMDSFVGVQGAGCAETLCACQTNVRLFTWKIRATKQCQRHS